VLKLYELPAHYQALYERSDEGEDVTALLAALDDALEARATHLIAMVRGIDAEAEALREEERRLRQRRDRLEMQSDAFRAHVKGAMLSAGVSKIKAPAFTISLREGADKVVVEDEAHVPPSFFRVKRELDKQAILRAYKDDGECVAGTHVVREPSLQIR
jgi:hypothetical protein